MEIFQKYDTEIEGGLSEWVHELEVYLEYVRL